MKKIMEEIMFSKKLEKILKGYDVVSAISEFLTEKVENFLSWSRDVGICTDGALAIQALASKTLPENLSTAPKVVIRAVNKIKSGCQEKAKLNHSFTDYNFIFSLTYRENFFETLNNLNLKLKSRNTIIMNADGAIRAV
ncbi:uncharacterized protein LOC126235317 [Schistocerca nitens]|uniref:uncharacterized protein LOC126235317 n=1 Tax=Schistocerca nitens TaxID=7011 RepID=UPI0021187DD5|nr:uncharacterized protein LOC126235317 [Schistocerca nitens]